MEKLQIAFEVIDIVLATLLLVGIVFAWKTFRGDQDQRRRSYAMHLYDEWRALLDLSEVRPTLEMVRDNRLVGDDLQKLLTDDEEATLAIGQKQFNHDEILKMRNHVVAILNFFEQVAVARRDNIGDAKMIDAYIGVAIMDHYNALRPFMAEWENKKARRAWIPLDTAATEYWGDRLEGGRNPI